MAVEMDGGVVGVAADRLGYLGGRCTHGRSSDKIIDIMGTAGKHQKGLSCTLLDWTHMAATQKDSERSQSEMLRCGMPKKGSSFSILYSLGFLTSKH
jgi:hypothetical protein